MGYNKKHYVGACLEVYIDDEYDKMHIIDEETNLDFVQLNNTWEGFNAETPLYFIPNSTLFGYRFGDGYGEGLKVDLSKEDPIEWVKELHEHFGDTISKIKIAYPKTRVVVGVVSGGN